MTEDSRWRFPSDMLRLVEIALYVAVMVAVIIGLDLEFFKHRLWERLTLNIGLVLVFAAFAMRFLKASMTRTLAETAKGPEKPARACSSCRHETFVIQAKRRKPHDPDCGSRPRPTPTRCARDQRHRALPGLIPVATIDAWNRAFQPLLRRAIEQDRGRPQPRAEPLLRHPAVLRVVGRSARSSTTTMHHGRGAGPGRRLTASCAPNWRATPR